MSTTDLTPEHVTIHNEGILWLKRSELTLSGLYCPISILLKLQ